MQDQGCRGRAVLRWRAATMLAVAIGVSACGQRSGVDGERQAAARPEQAGQPMGSLQTAGRIATIQAAAILGDQEMVRAQMEGFQDDVRRSIRLADPARAVDRESARAAARQVDGVRSVAWIDHENLMVIVASNQARSQAVIDAICMQLEPLGDTLGVVVNLQSGAYRRRTGRAQPQLPAGAWRARASAASSADRRDTRRRAGAAQAQQCRRRRRSCATPAQPGGRDACAGSVHARAVTAGAAGMSERIVTRVGFRAEATLG